ncbi:uncharacterized protein METZ01_LOCUS428730, partial [marine metagenome]
MVGKLVCAVQSLETIVNVVLCGHKILFDSPISTQNWSAHRPSYLLTHASIEVAGDASYSMGLQSLLPLLSPVKVRVNLGQLAQGKPGGIIIAQDAYVWLHEFTAKQARRVVIEKDRMVVAQEMLLRCRRFMACGVTVVLVFDGKRQKAKASTDEKRTRKRLKALAEVERLLGIDD